MLEPGAHLFFIGIGGIGVSAVARIAVGRGFRVSGSDVRASQLTDAMEALGATVFIGHDPANLRGVDCVIVSTAIPAHNPELVAAHETGLRVLHRSELLAALLASTLSIGVTGTHGKGTTAAMITRILDEGGRDPGFIIGGLLLDYGVNARAGGGDVLVAEVDESDGSHANVPTHVVLCNFLEADHLNYYRDRDHIIESMIEAIQSNPLRPRVFVNAECDGNQRLMDALGEGVVTYGVGCEADYTAVMRGSDQLPIRFEVFRRGTSLGDFSLPLPGLYNVTNALGAIAVCDALEVPVDAMRSGLSTFRGLENRFTIVHAGGRVVVKDYNSHPTAIRKVIESARGLASGRIISVFKPYRYTLTHYLRDEYATAFRGSDTVLITTMYAANEDPIPGVDTAFVVRLLTEGGLDVVHLPDAGDIVPWLRTHTREGDIVLFFGGDDFFQMADGWTHGLVASASHSEDAP